jgi:hypothetical protein
LHEAPASSLARSSAGIGASAGALAEAAGAAPELLPAGGDEARAVEDAPVDAVEDVELWSPQAAARSESARRPAEDRETCLETGVGCIRREY